MKQYKDLILHVLANGQERGDRTGTGTLSVFGPQMRFDLAEGFPLVTLKRTFFRGAAEELLWMLSGETNVRPLQEKGVHIWDEWADASGELGPIYGAQWRSVSHNGVDQIQELIDGLRERPFSRRHIVSAWNPADLPIETTIPQENAAWGRMALAPCHCLFQFYVDEDAHGHQRLSCQLYQRSADVFLGVPFNIAGYSLLIHLLAHHLDMEPGEFVWTGGDVHLYLNHLDQAHELIDREPRPLPSLALNHNPDTPIDLVCYEDLELIGYDPHPAIKAPVAV